MKNWKIELQWTKKSNNIRLLFASNHILRAGNDYLLISYLLLSSVSFQIFCEERFLCQSHSHDQLLNHVVNIF